jgi:hypothetical protein
MKAQLRRDELDFMTSIQALMHQLADDDWFFAFQKNRRNQINHLFFLKKSSQIILKVNYEVLVMNCIYKTNKYKMSFFIINDQIALHKNFYVVFCFMTKEKQKDYMWILQQLKALYAKLKISNSTVLLIDMKKDMQNWNFLIQFNSVAHRHEKRINECLSFDFFYFESFVMFVTYQQQRFNQLQKAFHHQRNLKQILFWIKRNDVCFF